MLGLRLKKSSVYIFIASAILSLLALTVERAVGIDWDFHPDSVTYATASVDIAHNVLESGFFSGFNNLYYLIVASLNMNIYAVTTMNIILFSLTNIKIYQLHNILTLKSNLLSKSKYLSLLVLFNPYRIHLSTTMLKDNLIIYLFILSIFPVIKYRYLIPLFAMRVVSVIYYLILIKKNHLYFLGALAFGAVLIFPDLFDLIDTFNMQEMDFRDFNIVPSFQNYGIYGSFIRASIWPVITLTGFYLALSPSLLFLPLAIGQWMQLYYMKKMGLRIFDVRVLSILFLFSLMVTGYTSYLRYVLPIMVISPFVGIFIFKREKN